MSEEGQKSEKKYYVYLLECADNSLYCGITDDREKRLKKHNAGTASKYTRSRLPVKMVYSEEAESKSEALKRELAIKAMSRSKKLSLINSK